MSEQAGRPISQQVDEFLAAQKQGEVAESREQELRQELNNQIQRDQIAQIALEGEVLNAKSLKLQKPIVDALLADIADVAGALRHKGINPWREYSGVKMWEHRKRSPLGKYVFKNIALDSEHAVRRKSLGVSLFIPLIAFYNTYTSYTRAYDGDPASESTHHQLLEKIGFTLQEARVVAVDYTDKDTYPPKYPGMPLIASRMDAADDLVPLHLIADDVDDISKQPLLKMYRTKLFEIGVGLAQGKFVSPLSGYDGLDTENNY